MKTRMLLCCLVVSSAVIVAADESPAPDMRAILADAGFGKEEIRKLGSSSLVNEVEVADRSRQAAFAGLIRIEGDAKAIAARMLGDGAPVLTTPDRFGYFGAPANAKDLATLKLDDDDYEVLSECKPAACRFKLTEQGIAHAQSVDWLSQDAPQVFLEQFRTALAAQTARYQREGLSGALTYDDKPKPFPVAQGVEQLSEEMRVLARLEPELVRYLHRYPADRPEGISERLFWGVSDFGYRPTLSVEHVVVREAPQSSSAILTMVMRTIYANHYLAGRLQFGSLIDGEAAFGLPGLYVLVMDRMLFDDELSGLKRSLLGRGLKSNVEDRLAHIRNLAAGDGS